MNKAPRPSVCRATEPRAGEGNCGRNARKNKDTLGLVRFMMMPRRNRAEAASFGAGAAPCARPCARKAPQARYSKYRAPANFSTMKADSEAAKTAASPTATARVWPKIGRASGRESVGKYV